MTSGIYETDVYAESSRAQVLGAESRRVEPVPPLHPKTHVWMTERAVRATVAAAVVTFAVSVAVTESRAAVDPQVLRTETCVDNDEPSWMRSITERIRALRSLAPGWDSYQALPVTVTAITCIVEVLENLVGADTPVPSVAPTAEGGVQVEWHESGVDLELRTDGEGRVFAFFQDRRTDFVWDDLLPDPSLAAPWMAHLSTVI